MMSTILNRLRSALASAALKVSLAAVLLFLAFGSAGPNWCHYDRGCPPELFLTRIDASLFVALGAILLFFAAKQVARDLIGQRLLAREGESPAPFYSNPDEDIYLRIELHDDLKPVTDPDWWIQAPTDG